MPLIDQTDALILKLLQSKGNVKRVEIAKETQLSVPTVSARIRKMEKLGLIEGYHAVLDRKKLGVHVVAFIRIFVDTSDSYEPLLTSLCDSDEVMEVHSITGEGSHLVKVCSRDTAALEDLLARIQAWPGITGTRTSVVLSSYKQTSQIPVVPDQSLPNRR